MVDVSAPLREPRPSPKRLLAVNPRTFARRLKTGVIRTASRSGFLASLYFAFLSRRFDREHRAVLAGQARYLANDMARCASFGGFRRNVHRIEKALVMRPRRASFGEAYIGETVAQFARAQGGALDPAELKWAGDILTLYFATVQDTPAIAAARRAFERAGYRDGAAAPFVPYKRGDVTPSGVDFADLRALFIERRSVRWFEDRPVPMDLLDQAIEAAGWAPTACNRQPYRFHVFTHPERAIEIAGLAGGTAGFLENIPCVVVLVGDLSNYIEERDRHLVYIDGSLAAMQFMLATQTLGLSTVPLNWPDVEDRERRMQKELGLEEYERPIMLIGVGYGCPDGYIPYSQKKPVQLTSRKNR